MKPSRRAFEVRSGHLCSSRHKWSGALGFTWWTWRVVVGSTESAMLPREWGALPVLPMGSTVLPSVLPTGSMVLPHGEHGAPPMEASCSPPCSLGSTVLPTGEHGAPQGGNTVLPREHWCSPWGALLPVGSTEATVLPTGEHGAPHGEQCYI